jgi:MATE family multidrug resistance protein
MKPPQPSSERSLSWQARPTRALIALAWPITLSGLSFAMMGVVDTALVATQGASELAGVGLGAIITTALLGFGAGLLRGVKLLLAQVTGAPAYARVVIGAGVLVALGLGAAVLVIGELVALAIPSFTASQAAGEAARAYIAVRSLGAPIVLLYVALREGRYGLGDTRSALVSALIGNVAHAGLDYIALIVLGWGARGAAAANVVAFTLQAAILLRAYGPREISLGRGRRWVGDVVRAGGFTGLQWLLEVGAAALLSLLLAGLSDRDMAAHQIAVQLTAFSFLPALAIAEAVSLLTGEAVGSGRVHLVPRAARAALTVTLSYAAFCALVFALGGGLIARAFSDDAELIAVARSVLLAAALHQLLEAAVMAGHGVLRGVGAQRLSAVCAIGCAWVCLPLPAYLLTRALPWGAPGGWLARVIEAATALSFVWWQIERLGWLPSARRSYRAARRARALAAAE